MNFGLGVVLPIAAAVLFLKAFKYFADRGCEKIKLAGSLYLYLKWYKEFPNQSEKHKSDVELMKRKYPGLYNLISLNFRMGVYKDLWEVYRDV